MAFQSSRKPNNESASTGVCGGLFLDDTPSATHYLRAFLSQRPPTMAEMSVNIWNSAGLDSMVYHWPSGHCILLSSRCVWAFLFSQNQATIVAPEGFLTDFV